MNDPKRDPPVETPDRATLAARLRELQEHLTLAGANWTGTKTGLSFMEDAELVRQAADALAATCATCRFWKSHVYAMDTMRTCIPPRVDLNYGNPLMTHATFGCTLHQPTGRTEREG